MVVFLLESMKTVYCAAAVKALVFFEHFTGKPASHFGNITNTSYYVFVLA